MSDFRPPARIKIDIKMESYSSGLQSVSFDGDTLGVVAALRAVLEREGMGVPEEWRESVLLADSGPAHGSVYSVDSARLPIKGRHVDIKEAHRFGVAVLRGLGAIVEEPEPIEKSEPAEE